MKEANPAPQHGPPGITGNYDGGKGRIFQHLISLMPPHTTYIEGYLGGGAVLWNKKPARLNIGIDLNPTVIAEHKASIAGFDGAEVSPESTVTPGHPPLPLTVRAATVINDEHRTPPHSTMLANTYSFNGASWQFIATDALHFLRHHDWQGGELVYLDPPYLMETRARQRRLYVCEYERSDHVDMLAVIKTLPCLVMLSGYWSDLYFDSLPGWTVHRFKTYKRNNEAVWEFVWCNYPKPLRLHDYGHLGRNYRERERIKRKKARWVKKLKKMPTLERQAILAAIDETFFPEDTTGNGDTAGNITGNNDGAGPSKMARGSRK